MAESNNIPIKKKPPIEWKKGNNKWPITRKLNPNKNSNIENYKYAA
jgi:hypothetical protein